MCLFCYLLQQLACTSIICVPGTCRCYANITERKKETNEEYDEEEVKKAAEVMGYGAVKYADLKNSRLTNYRWVATHCTCNQCMRSDA